MLASSTAFGVPRRWARESCGSEAGRYAEAGVWPDCSGGLSPGSNAGNAVRAVHRRGPGRQPTPSMNFAEHYASQTIWKAQKSVDDRSPSILGSLSVAAPPEPFGYEEDPRCLFVCCAWPWPLVLASLHPVSAGTMVRPGAPIPTWLRVRQPALRHTRLDRGPRPGPVASGRAGVVGPFQIRQGLDEKGGAR